MADRVEDDVCGGSPAEGFGLVVPGCQPLVDGAFQFGDAVKSPAADHALGDQSEPALHLIKPEAAGGGEVNVEAKALFRFEPAHHLGPLWVL